MNVVRTHNFTGDTGYLRLLMIVCLKWMMTQQSERKLDVNKKI